MDASGSSSRNSSSAPQNNNNHNGTGGKTRGKSPGVPAISAADNSDVDDSLVTSDDESFDGDTSNFAMYIPDKVPVDKDYKGRAKCPGCQTEYILKKKSGVLFSESKYVIEFYQHIIFECPAHADSG